MRLRTGAEGATLELAPVEPAPRGELVVVGCGTNGLGGMTADAIRQLAAARRIFVLEPAAVWSDLLPALADRFLSLDSTFDESSRGQALEQIARTVAEAALAAEGVVLALFGHPTVAVTPVARLLAWAASGEGPRLRLVAGVSSASRAWAELGIDPALGMQMVVGAQADGLASDRPVTIMCPGYASDHDRAARASALAALGLALRRTYGQPARFLVVRLEAAAQIRGLSWAQLATLMDEHLGSLLVIGPLAMLPSFARARDRDE